MSGNISLVSLSNFCSMACNIPPGILLISAPASFLISALPLILISSGHITDLSGNTAIIMISYYSVGWVG